MARLLILKEKKEEIDGRTRTTIPEKHYYVTDLEKDFCTQYGNITKNDLKAPTGTTLKSTTNKEFTILDTDYIDQYKQLKKLPQTIPLKDIGIIITETGIGKDSIIVDGGAGSGGLSMALARVTKNVTTYDIRDDHIEITKQNIKQTGLTNITVKKGSLYEEIEEKNADLITIDVPEPWRAINTAINAVKVGGWIVSYSPTILQSSQMVDAARKDEKLNVHKTIELIEREWNIDGRIIRPSSEGIGHSGFLTFIRKIKA